MGFAIRVKPVRIQDKAIETSALSLNGAKGFPPSRLSGGINSPPFLIAVVRDSHLLTGPIERDGIEGVESGEGDDAELRGTQTRYI